MKLDKDNILLISLPLAKQIGLKEAIVLQQVHYWLNPKLNKNIYHGCYWVYNTYDKWQQQFPFWHTRTIRRIFKELEEKNLIRSFVKKSLSSSKYYTINYEALKRFSKSKQHTKNHKTLGSQNEYVEKTDRDKQDTLMAKSVIEGNKSFFHEDKLAIKGGQNVQRGGQKMYVQWDKLADIYKDTEITQRILFPSPLTPLPNNKIDHGNHEVKHEEGIYQHLIDIWNQHVQSNLKGGPQTISLPKELYPKLQKLFQTVFLKDLSKWESYCAQIRNCRFLMGGSASGFKITLGWALNEKNALKILEGRIYDKPKENFKEKPWLEFENELGLYCKKHNFPDPWFDVCKHLARRCGQDVFLAWFQEMHPKYLTPTTASITVKSQFTKDYIKVHYYRELEKALKNVLPKLKNIEIHVEASRESRP